MTDASPIPPLDNTRSDSEHEAIVARIVRLEVNAEYTIKTLDLMQRRMDDGFKQLTEAIGQLRTEMHADTNQLRKEISSNFRWLMGVQLTTIFAIMGMLARMANFF